MDNLIDLALATWLGWLTWKQVMVKPPDLRALLREAITERLAQPTRPGSGRERLRARLAAKLAAKGIA
jgi:hypothetical protein